MRHIDSNVLILKYMKKELQYSLLGASVLLLMGLFPMSRGYYVLIRFVAMVIFACLAYYFYKKGDIMLSIVSGSMVLMFQPLIRIALSREVWHVVDIVVAVILVVFWYKERKQ